MSILGIDYGTKRVGLALSDDTETIAFPKTVLKNSKTLVSEVVSFIESNDVKEIVVGESLNLAGESNPLMKEIEEFISSLKSILNISIHLEPEFFTSFEARKGYVSSDMIDASAAALILQRFLDKNNKK